METLKEGTWYIKGCEELEEYFDKSDIDFQCDFSTHGYYIENGEWDCNIIEHIQHRTELTYPEFIKLFEGGESKEDFAIYKRTFNKIPYPRVEWECNCGFKHCINEGFEQDYRKDNFKEIRFPTGKCLKCKKEIRTQSLEIKEVLQVENNGWIKILSETDLPKEVDQYWFASHNNKIEIRFYNPNWINDRVQFRHRYTHYQPIVKPLPPKF